MKYVTTLTIEYIQHYFQFHPFFPAVFTISGVIFVSMAILVFMGWKLNILESVAITLAIGLSVDFTLHYAMMFKKGNNCEDQESAVIYSVTKMGGPVSMAAFTTIIPELCMLPSRYVLKGPGLNFPHRFSNK